MKKTLMLLPFKLTIFIAFIYTNNVAFSQQVAPEPPRGLMAGQPVSTTKSSEPGLLFYLSGDKQFTADFAAGGQTLPNFLKGIKSVPNGAYGSAFECSDEQLMSYWAPGNVYAQRVLFPFFGVPVILLDLPRFLFFV